jgi:hypothetical protein
MTEPLDFGEEVVHGLEADAPFTKSAAGDDLGLKFVVVSEEEAFAHSDFATGAHQAFPFIGVPWVLGGGDLAGEQDFNAATKKIPSRGIARTKGLGLKTGSPAVQARWKDAGVVEYNEVVGPQEVRKVAEKAVVAASGGAIEMQQARGRTIGKRLLSDQLLGQMIVEV